MAERRMNRIALPGEDEQLDKMLRPGNGGKRVRKPNPAGHPKKQSFDNRRDYVKTTDQEKPTRTWRNRLIAVIHKTPRDLLVL